MNDVLLRNIRFSWADKWKRVKRKTGDEHRNKNTILLERTDRGFFEDITLGGA